MIKAPIRLQDLRRRLYVKAKAEPTWRFWGLYVHVCKRETLWEAYQLATFRRKIAVFDPAILCSEGDGNYLAVSFGPRSTIPGAAPLTTCWLAVGPGDGRC